MTIYTTSESSVSVPSDAPLHVNALRVLGISSTRESFLNSVIGDIFDAHTTKDVLQNVQEAAKRLQRHDIFEDIKVFVNTSHVKPDTVDVTFELKEKGKGYLSTIVSAGENETNMTGTVSFRNLFGGAEFLSARYTFGSLTKAAGEGVIGIPIQGSPDARLEAFVRGSIKDHSMINFYKEHSKAVGARVKCLTPLGNHEFSYALAHRDVTAMPKSSATVRAHSGSNVKSSLFHTCVNDTRDSATMPSQGRYLCISQELAGIGQKGDAHFMKHEITAQVHQTILGGNAVSEDKVVLNAGVKLGYLAILSADKDINVSDRFYLGGPLNVRGFKTGGIGPRDGNDALGGDLYYAAGVSLTSSIPGAAYLPIKAHVFVNSGNLMNRTKGVPLNKSVEQLVKESRTSTGFGLIFHHELARIEANFCVPLQFKTGDLAQAGLQFGLGLNFL